MKPITILKREFDEKLVELVNGCGLPACVIKPSVEQLVNLLNQMEAAQYQADLKAMQEQEKEAEE